MAARLAIAPLQYRHKLTTCPRHKQPFVVALGIYVDATCQSKDALFSDDEHIKDGSAQT